LTGTRHADSAFIVGDVSPELLVHYEHIAALVKKGRLILLVGSGVMLVALVIATGRGEAGLRSWLVLPVALVLAFLFSVVDRRLTERPPGSVEVPIDLAERLLTLQEMGDDIVGYPAAALSPMEHDRVAVTTRKQVASAIATAGLVLAAERADDVEASARLRAELARIDGELETTHNAVVPHAHDMTDDVTSDAAGAGAPRTPNATWTKGTESDDTR
jgi:hypothetical protein